MNVALVCCDHLEAGDVHLEETHRGGSKRLALWPESISAKLARRLPRIWNMTKAHPNYLLAIGPLPFKRLKVPGVSKSPGRHEVDSVRGYPIRRQSSMSRVQPALRSEA